MVPGDASKRLGLLFVLLGLAVYFSAKYPNFHTGSNVEAILLNCSSIAIAGIGTTALLISGNVDLSIGTQWAFNGMFVGWIGMKTHSPVAAVAAGLAAGAVIGLVNGHLVRFLRISPLIVTLATNLLWGGLAFVMTSGEPIADLPPGLVSLGTSAVAGVALPVIIAGVLFALGGAWLVYTVSGLRVYALGGNAEVARLTGVRVERSIVNLYVLQSVLVAVVAILTTARLANATPQVGTNFSLDVLTAVILGGVAFTGGSGHPLGVLIGILTLATLDAGLIFGGLEDWWQQIARAVVLLLALVADQVLATQRDRGRVMRLRRRPEERAVQDVGGMPDAVARQPTEGRVGEPVLVCEGLSRSYGAVNATNDVSFDVRAGEIVCLVGDNGAGKSTLVKMVSGAIVPTEGRVLLAGDPLAPGDPGAARRAGIETVFQDLALCPNLSVIHNMTLGDEPAWTPPWMYPRVRDDAEAARRAGDRLERFGVALPDMRRVVRYLSGGQRQSVAIARALKDGTRLVILDEPTASLGVRQTARVLETIKSVAAEGTAVLLVSHDLESVFAVADRVVVLRQGRLIHDGPTSELSQGQLVHMMAGLGAVPV